MTKTDDVGRPGRGARGARYQPVPGTGIGPRVISVSDVHGYLDDCRSALLAVSETDRFAPVVTADDDGTLHWAGNDYVLVFNGDLVDRGDDSEGTVELMLRLLREAPPGRVRYHLGNHEMGILLSEEFHWPRAYSQVLDRDLRRRFVSLVADGVVTAAFEGYRYTYSHAGDTDGVDVEAVNETAREAGLELLATMDTGRYESVQSDIPHRFDDVFGLGGPYGRGEEAGILWMDFEHMPTDAPPQVVGHTRQATPTRVGRTVCGNVIRTNVGSPGGEGALLETPDELLAITKREDGGVSITRP
jgi:hypothetical protein